jgi:hypothetical protein
LPPLCAALRRYLLGMLPLPPAVGSRGLLPGSWRQRAEPLLWLLCGWLKAALLLSSRRWRRIRALRLRRRGRASLARFAKLRATGQTTASSTRLSPRRRRLCRR